MSTSSHQDHDAEGPTLNVGHGSVVDIEAGLAEVARELAHRTEAVAS